MSCVDCDHPSTTLERRTTYDRHGLVANEHIVNVCNTHRTRPPTNLFPRSGFDCRGGCSPEWCGWPTCKETA